MTAAQALLTRMSSARFTTSFGRVRRVRSGFVEADGPMSSVGDVCHIETGGEETAAEVVAVNEDRVVLVPFGGHVPIRPNATVRAGATGATVGVGQAFGGRAVGALGQPLDGQGAIHAEAWAPLSGRSPAPLDRVDPRTALTTGLRAIDGLLTLGVGQRVGIFAASGVGKTSLVEQLVRQVRCDRLVVCLVGERGREVERFWRQITRGDARNATLVAATSDESAAMRARAVRYAVALAEHWRDEGRHVVLVVDSVTRMAMALREIGLSADEPPSVRGYTPNVFSALPHIVERCGATRGGGAITAFFTVLTETDDADDPIAELMRSLLDGHVVLSRRLAELSHFPAIDAVRSVSRNAPQLRHPAHDAAARAVAALLGTYEEARTMVESGLYRPGSNPALDRAIGSRDELSGFLRQGLDEESDFAASVERLIQLSGEASAHG